MDGWTIGRWREREGSEEREEERETREVERHSRIREREHRKNKRRGDVSVVTHEKTFTDMRHSSI